jgi:hypothetical protein
MLRKLIWTNKQLIYLSSEFLVNHQKDVNSCRAHGLLILLILWQNVSSSWEVSYDAFYLHKDERRNGYWFAYDNTADSTDIWNLYNLTYGIYSILAWSRFSLGIAYGLLLLFQLSFIDSVPTNKRTTNTPRYYWFSFSFLRVWETFQ